MAETQAKARSAEQLLQQHSLDDLDETAVARVLADKMLAVSDPRLIVHDEYAPLSFGVDMPERVFWEAFVARATIAREGPWVTGRASTPAFMDANLASTRSGDDPKTVVMQTDLKNPLNPVSLVVAYAEQKVLPVSSDMDAFLVGSRGVAATEIPKDQVPLVHWLLDTLAAHLDPSKPEAFDLDACWTTQWLAILKQETKRGFHPTPPKFGWGDARTYG